MTRLLRVHATLLASLVAATSLAIPVEDLPLIRHDITVHQVSSHNKEGLNGDAGFTLYTEEGEVGSVSWGEPDQGATASYSAERVHDGKGAILHKVTREGRESGWRSICKPLSAGLNVADCDEVSLWVWPSYADGQVDYGIRIDSAGHCTEMKIQHLKPQEWNHVTLDVSEVPRKGVTAFWLLFHIDWGMEELSKFYVDDIAFVGKDGRRYGVDDFEKGAELSVCFDALGPGCLKNFWGLGGSDIRIEVDGETMMHAPQDDFYQGLVPGFPSPLVFKGLVASGPWKCQAHWSFVPIPFRKRCRILTRNPRPMFHYIWESYQDQGPLQGLGGGEELAKLKGLWEVRGTDPKRWPDLRRETGAFQLPPGEAKTFLSLDGGGAVASLKLRLSQRDQEILDRVRLRIGWDGEKEPSVDSPVGIFFGAGVAWQDVPSLLIGVDGEWGYCYFPMPFWKSARFSLENQSDQVLDQVQFVVTVSKKRYPKGETGFFRTWFHRTPETALGRDYLFLDVPGQGQFVGVVQTLIGGHYCEGDERFYIDGSRSPAFYGTGTEDYYLAACWPSKDHHSPFHGCVGDVALDAEGDQDKTFYDFRSCYYRIHLDAPVRFSRSIHCGIEHGGTNDTRSSYTSLAYYYSIDRQALIQTDHLSVGDEDAEKAHGFRFGDDAKRFPLESYFEGDDDDVLVRFDGVSTEGPVEVNLQIDEENEGVRLRRVLDQGVGRQWADVWVDGKLAGSWCDPDQNSFKRLAESEFEIPSRLTHGKKRIHVEFRPKNGPWTILELKAFSTVQDGPDVRAERIRWTR